MMGTAFAIVLTCVGGPMALVEYLNQRFRNRSVARQSLAWPVEFEEKKAPIDPLFAPE